MASTGWSDGLEPLPGFRRASLPVTLPASRLRGSALFAGSLLFTALGCWMAADTHPRAGGACAVFAGLCCVVFLINLLPGASFLRLDEDGFTFSSLYRRRTIDWASVSGFGVMALQRTLVVGWTFVPNYQQMTRMRRLNRDLVGFDAGLPDTYGKKAVDLAVAMETLRGLYWMEHGLTENDIAGEVVPPSGNAAWAGSDRILPR